MKPPEFKIDEHYHVRYVQVPYDDRYFKVFSGNKFCIQIPVSELELLYVMIVGFSDKMDPPEKISLFDRYRKFLSRVEEKDKWLDRNL